MELINDETLLTDQIVGENVAVALTLGDCLERGILVSPDSGKHLRSETSSGVVCLTDGRISYKLMGTIPVCYPSRITVDWEGGRVPMRYGHDSLNQYILLSQIKQHAEITAPSNSDAVLKHSFRFRKFCADLVGTILDIGCDLPSASKRMFSSSCEYLGLDPYTQGSEFRIIGIGEILPFATNSFDAVVFNTSLDHILDYHTAIGEAHRVLKHGGTIVLASYAWINNATLLTDSVHFHHFREFELVGALEECFKIVEIARYQDPKSSDHRYGIYIKAIKV